MDKLDRTIQQRIHFNKAMAELYSILEYFVGPKDAEDFQKMKAKFEKFEEEIRTNSPIA